MTDINAHAELAGLDSGKTTGHLAVGGDPRWHVRPSVSRSRAWEGMLIVTRADKSSVPFDAFFDMVFGVFLR